MTRSISAYPNNSEYMQTPAPYNLIKWMDAIKRVYLKTHLGASKTDSLNEITKEWPVGEKRDFLTWVNYYESGEYKKYKTANDKSYYVNDDIPNYFIPNPKSAPSPLLNLNVNPADIAKNVEKYRAEDPEEKRKLIEDQRRKLLGRLNSAEKLLGSHHGQMFAGPEFEKLLSAIYELKKQIQTVNKRSSSNQLYFDLIVRQANILNHQGFDKASNLLRKFAQNTPGNFDFNMGPVPSGGSNIDSGSSLGNTPPTADALLKTPSDILAPKPEEDGNEGLNEFLKNLEDGGLSSEDDKNHSENDDVEMDADDISFDQDKMDGDLFVEAQAMPEPPKMPVKAPNADVPADGDVQKNIKTPAKMPEELPKQKTDYDNLIDSAFSNITVQDVIDKLESINNIFRNREISRQLSIVDLMLHRLGLSGFFDNLSEALNKTLEGNNYAKIRIEDIISKLRGSIAKSDIDLENTAPVSPENEAVRNRLEQAEQKEKARKEMRKKINDKDLEEETKPEIEVENVPEEIAAQPAKIAPPAPKPVAAPLIPPKTPPAVV